MNREIKFRAWYKGTKEMHKVICLNIGTISDVVLEHNKIKDTFVAMTENVNIMQFTGLHDKNNVDIYEGDIVEYYSYEHIKYLKMYVYYHLNMFLLCQTKSDCDYKDFCHFIDDWDNLECKVIGNIYENKELLGE